MIETIDDFARALRDILTEAKSDAPHVRETHGARKTPQRQGVSASQRSGRSGGWMSAAFGAVVGAAVLTTSVQDESLADLSVATLVEEAEGVDRFAVGGASWAYEPDPPVDLEEMVYSAELLELAEVALLAMVPAVEEPTEDWARRLAAQVVREVREVGEA